MYLRGFWFLNGLRLVRSHKQPLHVTGMLDKLAKAFDFHAHENRLFCAVECEAMTE